MSEQQWEYCELGLAECKKHGKGLLGGGKEGRSYDCYIRYYGPDGGIYHVLADIDKIMPFNPFDKALYLLGKSEWELVSIQFGNRVESGSIHYDTGHIRWDNRVAFLKRPVRAGRKVEEPKLAL